MRNDLQVALGRHRKRMRKAAQDAVVVRLAALNDRIASLAHTRAKADELDLFDVEAVQKWALEVDFALQRGLVSQLSGGQA